MQVKSVPQNDVELDINIRFAKNGIVVNGHAYGEGLSTNTRSEDETYVYSTLEEALQEIPSLVSVLKESVSGKGKMTPKNMPVMEAQANKTVSGGK